MRYFVILLILVGFPGSVFAQNLGDTQDDIWMPACLKESNAGCDHSSLFHDAVSKPFAQSDSVAVGTIIQKEKQEQNSIKYSINVNFYLKNYQPFDLLTATLNNATEPQTFPEVLYYNSPVFNEGDLVFVYLKKIEGQYNILPESFALDKQEVRGPPPTILLTKSPFEDNFEQGDEILVSGEVRKMDLVKAAKDSEQLDVKLTLYDENNQVIFSDLIDINVDGSYRYGLQTSVIPPGKYELEVNYGPSTTGDRITIEFNPRYWTPLKQFKSGIPINEIQCKEGLEIILKLSDDSPACVTSQTKQKLIQRGWSENYDDNITIENYKIDCNYPINPYQEYECFKNAYSNCQIATVNPEIYTIEGDPVYTNLTITPDCKIQGMADMSTDRFWGVPKIITTKCDTINRDEYVWSVKNCDAENLPEMQFNFEMQLYHKILECEENGNTWNREKLECVVNEENEN